MMVIGKWFQFSFIQLIINYYKFIHNTSTNCLLKMYMGIKIQKNGVIDHYSK